MMTELFLGELFSLRVTLTCHRPLLGLLLIYTWEGFGEKGTVGCHLL